MPRPLTDDDRTQMLALARRAVADAAAGRTPTPPPADGALATRAGAFVSLHQDGDLRGCIGHIAADRPLALVLCDCGAAAATGDPRFPPVTPAEVAGLQIEISILSGLEPVQDPADIDVGRHGLLVQHGSRRGLLLPQVARERRWDRVTFLAQTCRKAGLPPDAWQHGAELFRFEADVFGETDARRGPHA